jgi:hypothetical protein
VTHSNENERQCSYGHVHGLTDEGLRQTIKNTASIEKGRPRRFWNEGEEKTKRIRQLQVGT